MWSLLLVWAWYALRRRVSLPNKYFPLNTRGEPGSLGGAFAPCAEVVKDSLVVKVKEWGGGWASFLEAAIGLVVVGEYTIKFDMKLCVVVQCLTYL